MKCHVSQGRGIQWVSRADPAPALLKLGWWLQTPRFFRVKWARHREASSAVGTWWGPWWKMERKRLAFSVCAYFLQTHWATRTHKFRPSDLYPEWWENRPNLPVNRVTRNLSNQNCLNSGRVWESPTLSFLDLQKPQLKREGGWILRSFKDSESVNGAETQCLRPSERLRLWTLPKN